MLKAHRLGGSLSPPFQRTALSPPCLKPGVPRAGLDGLVAREREKVPTLRVVLSDADIQRVTTTGIDILLVRETRHHSLVLWEGNEMVLGFGLKPQENPAIYPLDKTAVACGSFNWYREIGLPCLPH